MKAVDLAHKGTIVSIGYEGRSIDEFIDALSAARVDAVVDVRLTPSSRKPGFSKTRLRERLAQAEIDYWHAPELGNPRDNRDAFRSGSAASRRRFNAVLDNGAGVALQRLIEDARERRIAVLCFEREHERCHRSCITDRALSLHPLINVLKR